MDKKKIEQAKKGLTPEQYNICFLKGTEPPFSGKYTDQFSTGMYHCVVCNTPLFYSDSKFHSDSGWPSFDRLSILKISNTRRIILWGWKEPRYSAPLAVPTSAMSSRTGQPKPASATASTH